MRRGPCVLLLWLIVAAIAAPSALANYVYWPNREGGTIGRAGLDGGSLNNGFLTTTGSPPANSPVAVAVDSKFIYWAHNSEIGRANLDGTQPNPDFIPNAAGPAGVGGLAVDSKFIYWTDQSGIGRALLDGTQADPGYLADPHSPCGLAVDGSFLYYTVNHAAIARAPVNGSVPDDGFIPVPAGKDCGVAVDSGHVYWVEGGTTGGRDIGRASLDGSDVRHDLITGVGASGVAVTPQAIYWSSQATGSIGRAGLDGASPNQFFVQIGTAPDASPALLAASPSNLITLGPPKLNRKKGTARISAQTPGPGMLVVDDAGSGPQTRASRKRRGAGKVKQVQIAVTGPSTVTLPIKPAGRTLRKLRRKGRAHLDLGITFTPQGAAGVPGVQEIPIPLRHR
jgi:virginiamycin B lyase